MFSHRKEDTISAFTASSCSVGHGVLQRWLTSFRRSQILNSGGGQTGEPLLCPRHYLCLLYSVYKPLLAAVTNCYSFSKQLGYISQFRSPKVWNVLIAHALALQARMTLNI